MTEVGLRGDLQKINRNKKIVAKLRPPYPKRFRGHKAPTNKTESKLVIAAGDATIRLLKEVKCVSKKDLVEDHERPCIKMYPNAVNKKLTAGL